MGSNRNISYSKSTWILVFLLILLASSYSFSQIEEATKLNYHLKTSAVIPPVIAQERDSEESDEATLVYFVFNVLQVDIHAAPDFATSLPVNEIISLVFREQSRMNAP